MSRILRSTFEEGREQGFNQGYFQGVVDTLADIHKNGMPRMFTREELFPVTTLLYKEDAETRPACNFCGQSTEGSLFLTVCDSCRALPCEDQDAN